MYLRLLLAEKNAALRYRPSVSMRSIVLGLFDLDAFLTEPTAYVVKCVT